MRSFIIIVAAVVAIRVSEGAVATHDFGDVVLVGDDNSYWCSGVVIAPAAVLTAKHCARATRIAVGDDVQHARAITVVARFEHPSEDVALLKLEKPAGVTAHPRRSRAEDAPPSTTIAVIGFGVTDQIRFSDFGSRRVRFVEPDDWGCDADRSRLLGCRIGRELLLRGGRGNDTCFGDSGGGAFEETRDGWRLVGITSRGTIPKRIACGEGGVYVRIDYINPWLEEVLK